MKLADGVPGGRLGWRPELDGIRGLAVLLVMAGHFRVPSAHSAGPVGVMVFFGLSGFLITSLLLEEHTRTGKINMAGFFSRRAFRLLPALVVFLALQPVGLILIGRYDWLAQYPANVPPVLFYYSNFLFIEGKQLHPMGHIWTLAVEEQFYLVWPFLLLLLLTFARRRVLVVLAALMAASLLLRIALMGDPQLAKWVYCGSDTNAYALLGGCILAWLFHQGKISGGPAWLAPVALVGLLILTTWDNSRSPHVLLEAQVVVLLSGLLVIPLIMGALSGDALLRLPILCWFGTISYSLYLWHLPLSRLAKGSTPRGLVLAVVAVFVAWLSLRFIEKPALRLRARWGMNGQVPRPRSAETVPVADRSVVETPLIGGGRPSR